MLRLNNPFLAIFGGMGAVGKHGKTLIDYAKLLWLGFRTKLWYNAFPGIESLMEDTGREWIIKGISLAKEYTLLSKETDIDDVIVARISNVVTSTNGWESIKNIIRIALTTPEEMDDKSYDTMTTDIANEGALLTTGANEDGKCEDDPLVSLYITWIGLQIACLIRKKNEKTRNGKKRIDNLYQRAERKFFNKVISFRGRHNN